MQTSATRLYVENRRRSVTAVKWAYNELILSVDEKKATMNLIKGQAD